MTFEEILTQTVAMLQRFGRVPIAPFSASSTWMRPISRTSKGLLYAYPTVIDDVGRGLIWPSAVETPPEEPLAASRPAPPPLPQAAVQPPPEASPRALPSPEAERRQLTVLFCDLVDSLLSLAGSTRSTTARWCGRIRRLAPQ